MLDLCLAMSLPMIDSSAYQIHHTSASNRALSYFSARAQGLVTGALAQIAERAHLGGGAVCNEQVIAGTLQVAGAFVAYALDHDARVLVILAVEPASLRSRPRSDFVAA